MWGLVCAEGFEGVEGDDPGGDGGVKAFSEEWSEWDVFPFLNVAGAPVVEEDHAEDVILGGFDWDWGAVGVSGADEESGLEFEVEFLGGGESGGGVVGWGDLPGRAANIPVSGSD